MNDMNNSWDYTVTNLGEAKVLYGAARPDLIGDETLSEIFTASAERHADRICMISDDRRMTYAEVYAAAAGIARGLGRRNIGAGDVVGLWMTRGIDLLIAQIGIALSGAAWLPFDADAPMERIGVCLGDAEAKALITSEMGKQRANGLPCDALSVVDLVDTNDTAPLSARPANQTGESPAYLIYTSGSTGVPKGIVITQANIAHYLRSANEVYGLTSDDVVFQGASVAFDLSMEEIWIPYLVGATLFVATPEIIGETEKLAGLMSENGITVIDTVPTLLAMMTGDIPSLRIIILGGEACPPTIVQRWARPERRIFNSYGPTEATVVATVAEVVPDQPVTIGGPIPNYSCYVADENLKLVPPGQQGELLIGGPGVARGYLKRDELTAEKFIKNPYVQGGADPILYRSGDAVSIDEQGRIAFHGRIDDQVKIRGFRVELGEIETRVQLLPEIANAAVVLRRDDGIDQLVAFVIPESGVTVDQRGMRKTLRETMPAYMVPNRFEVVDTLPRLTSGKVDRKALRAVPLAALDISADQDLPQTDAEAALLDAAKKVFPGQAIPLEADFFTEMGGHSLLAARFVGHVREVQAYATITLQDVYKLRTLRAMAARLDEMGKSAQLDLSFTPPPFMRRFLCGLAQAIALPFLLFLMAAQWLGIFTTFLMLDGDTYGFWGQLIILLSIYVLITLGTGIIGIIGKWLVIGRTKPGVYPLWGAYYFRMWLASHLLMLIHVKWFQGTPIMRGYLRLVGCKVGKDAIISDFDAGAIDLVSFGDNVCTGAKTKFANMEVIGDKVYVGPIVLGNESYVGTSCVLSHDVTLEDGAELGDLTAVASGTVVPAYERWTGTPARKAGMVDQDALPELAPASPLRKRLLGFAYVIALIVVPPIGLLPIFPAFWVFDNVDVFISGFTKADTITYLPLLTWPTALALIVLTVLMTVAIRWILMPHRLKPGVYSVHSWDYFRKWVLGLITEVKLETLSSLFATLYMRVWYRMMGAKIGKGSEISTNLNGRYDLVDIGDNNFIADEVLLGDEDIRRGWMYLEPVKTGNQVFVGNDGVVPPGTVIENNSLIGIKSLPPESKHVGEGETWFGSPPIKLPVRQKVDIASNWTFEPSVWRVLSRALFEAVHTSIPTMLFISMGFYTVSILEPLIDQEAWLQGIITFAVAAMLIPVLMTLITAGIKWVLMGVYKPNMYPMWSFWAMRTEAVAVLYWGLAGKVFLEPLRGTPFLPMLLRIYGTKTGKGIFMNSTDITEFDCVTIGDYCAINAMSALQTHLYEDRIMKVGRVTLGTGVTVGAGSTVLYDTHVGDYAQLGVLTVVMKGESIPANTMWEGAPAQPAGGSH